MIISFSGLDGSGKTTQAKFLFRYLSEKGFKVKYTHMLHRSIFGLLSVFLKKYSKKSFDGINHIEFDLENKSFSKKLISLFRKFTYILDLFGFCLYIFINNLEGKIILCDRYFYDLVVQSRYMKLFGPHFSKFYLSLVPKPKISIFLEVSSRIGFERAKEKDIHFFNKKSELYNSLNNINLIPIKVTSLDETKKSVIKLVNNKLGIS